MTIEQKHNCDCDKRNGTTNQTGHFNDCPLSCQPTVGEWKADGEGRCWLCEAHNALYTLYGKSVCKQCFLNETARTPSSPTPNVGEEWDWYQRLKGYKGIEAICDEHGYGEFSCKHCIENLIMKALSQREARVRGETIAECVGVVEKVIPDRPYQKYEKCPKCGRQYQYECACGDLEDNIKEAILQALQSLSPNQK